MRLLNLNHYFSRLALPLALVAFLFSNGLSAAQLINAIPAKLSDNWTVCLHYESQEADCNQASLPEAMIHFPSTVKFQTYTKDFVISSDLKKLPLGFWLRVVDDVDKVSINGELIGKTGQFPPAFETGFRQQRLYFIPSELLKYNQFNRLEIQTFSSRGQTGIQSKAPVIGNYLEIQHHLQENDYYYIIAASILILLSIFPIFYFIVVKGNFETIYFLFFLIAYAILSIARSQIPIHQGLDLSSVFKLEIFMLNGAQISICLFIFNFFELELRRIYAFGLFLLGVAALFIIVWPSALLLRQIAEVNYWLIIVITFLVIGSALVVAIHKQRKYAWILFTTCTVGWLILSYDSVMLSSSLFQISLIQKPLIVPMVATAFGIIITLTLTHKYWHFFKGSTYDLLTGTLMRPAFFQRLSEEMQRCQRSKELLMVAVIDIQQAKKISINYGYSIGNHLLITVSNSLTKVLRPYDLICRFSDEQFCIASTITDRQYAETCLQRIYQELINIQQPINKNIELYVDARIGGVIYSRDIHTSVSHLVQDANYALAKTKSQSKQTYLLEQNPMAQTLV